MAATEYVQTFIRLTSRTDQNGARVAPAELRERIVEDALEAGSSLTGVIIGILASTYNVAVEPSKRRTTPQKDAEEFNLRLPRPLHAKIAMAAARSGHTVQREVLRALCAHYALRLPPKPRHARPGRRTATTLA